MMRSALVLLVALVTVTAGPLGWAEEEEPMEPEKPKLLLLTGGPIHDGQGIGDVFERHLAADGRYAVTRVHGDLDALTASRLEPFDVLVFYWTIESISDPQLMGLLNWVRAGGRFITFHSGGDSFRDCPAYRDLVGGYFVTHPHYRTYQVSVKDPEHPITRGIDEFLITDEQYILSWDARNHILANALWKGELMPVAWVKDYGAGKVFYCALGHDPKAVEQDMVHVLFSRAVAWAAGLEITDPKTDGAQQVGGKTDY